MLRARHEKWNEWPQIVVDLLPLPVMSCLHLAHSSPVYAGVVDDMTERCVFLPSGYFCFWGTVIFIFCFCFSKNSYFILFIFVISFTPGQAVSLVCIQCGSVHGYEYTISLFVFCLSKNCLFVCLFF